MNAAQVNQEWWRSMQAERAKRDAVKAEQAARLAAERQRGMRWSRQAFPDRVEAGWPCPFAAVLAIEAVRRRPDENPSRGQVEKRLLTLVQRRGDEQDPWWPRVTGANTTEELTGCPITP